MKLSDASAERAVLSGIFNYGEDAYYDVADLLQESSFTIDSNIVLYKCFKHIFERNPNTKLDIATIFSAAEELHLSSIVRQSQK